MAPWPLSAPPHPLAGCYKSVERPCQICSFPTRLRAPSGVWIHSFCALSFRIGDVRAGENSCDRRRKLGKRPHVKPSASDAERRQRLEHELAVARRRFPAGCVVVARWSLDQDVFSTSAPSLYVVTGVSTWRPWTNNPHGLARVYVDGYVWRDPNATTTCDVPKPESIAHPSELVVDRDGRYQKIAQAWRERVRKERSGR